MSTPDFDEALARVAGTIATWRDGSRSDREQAREAILADLQAVANQDGADLAGLMQAIDQAIERHVAPDRREIVRQMTRLALVGR